MCIDYALDMGIGMVASKSTFRTHLGRVNRGLSHMLHAARHATDSLVYSDYLREASASMCLVIISGQIATGVT